MRRIILDVYGADNSPHEILKGAIDAVNMDKELKVVLSGKQAEMEGLLNAYTYDAAQIEIVDAPEVITNDENPTSAIRAKKNSSLIRAIDVLNEDADSALVTAGSTGAVLAAATFKVGRMSGIQRPVLAPCMPTVKRTFVTVVDSGANIDCKPQFLSAFAVMGSAYIRALTGIERPRVALLSNGVEDKKGNELVQESFKLLKEIDIINFLGNMEARETLSGDYEVVVADGFAGNVLIKSIEGTAKAFGTLLKEEIKASASAKVGYLFMKKAMVNFKARMDVDAVGGAPLLGVKRLVIKSHGSSKAKAIRASLLQAKKLCERDLIAKLSADIESANLKTVRDV